MTAEKAVIGREVIERRTFASATPMRLTCWRFRVPLTGLCGAASSWELAIKRVCESLKEHEERRAAALRSWASQ